MVLRERERDTPTPAILWERSCFLYSIDIHLPLSPMPCHAQTKGESVILYCLSCVMWSQCHANVLLKCRKGTL